MPGEINPVLHTINGENRRTFERFSVSPAYTEVKVRVPGEPTLLEGHAYDISEGGVRMELDRAIEPGTSIVLEVKLPPGNAKGAPVEEVLARGTVMWADDDGVPGPVFMGVLFDEFATNVDRDRLLGRFASGAYHRAA
ncbi:MAG: PilZ domain-containing protein [Phycisphaeraceae bacterium]|nr:MAG: PilZ domain-containing protein [Phycisphaeraceae bacterium]